MNTNNKVETRTVDLSRFKNAVGLIVTFSSQWGLSRKGNMDGVTLRKDTMGEQMQDEAARIALANNPAEEAAAKERLGLVKRLLVSPEYKAIQSYFADLRSNFIYARTVPSFFKEGFQLASLEAVAPIEERLKRAIGLRPQISRDGNPVDELPQLVEKFLAAYPAQVEEARKRLEPFGQFRASDYPSTEFLRTAFSISWNWIAFSVPDQLPEELRNAEQEKLNRQLTDAGEQITQALRASFQELIAHATEKLTTEPGEKKKVFRDSLIGNIQEFLDTFNSRNLMNDIELARLVGEAREILSKGINAQTLRDSQTTREQVTKQFTKIKTELSAMITEQPGRKIRFDDDEPTPAAPTAETPQQPTPTPQTPATGEPEPEKDLFSELAAA